MKIRGGTYYADASTPWSGIPWLWEITLERKNGHAYESPHSRQRGGEISELDLLGAMCDSRDQEADGEHGEAQRGDEELVRCPCQKGLSLDRCVT
jgi:hypothetical protein